MHVDPYCGTQVLTRPRKAQATIELMIQNTDFLEYGPSPISTHLSNIFSFLNDKRISYTMKSCILTRLMIGMNMPKLPTVVEMTTKV